MGSFPVIIPPSPGLLCALGDLVADFRNEFARTLIRVADDSTAPESLEILDQLAERAAAVDGRRSDQRFRPGDRAFNADMRYRGQGYEIPVPVDVERVRLERLDHLSEHFNVLHEQLYGFRMPNTDVEIVNLRAIASGKLANPELSRAQNCRRGRIGRQIRGREHHVGRRENGHRVNS